MPTGAQWTAFLYVNLGFLMLVGCMFYYLAMENIKQNWTQYRCNPVYMPFADNIRENFTFCVQNTQVNLMGYLLQPLNYLISNLNSVGGEFSENLVGIRTMLSTIRDFITSIVENIFGVFSNIVIQFQVLTLSIKDIIGKTIGIVVAMLYILDGTNKTMVSAWEGPNGQLVRALGSCFHPYTLIADHTGKTYYIKDIPLGTSLPDGGKVLSVMRLVPLEPLCLLGRIWVAGSHFVFHHEQGWIPVSKHPDTWKPTPTPIHPIHPLLPTSEYICLITSTHRIPIDNYLFWDWEDDEVPLLPLP
jgi:hypothetical protein